MRVRWWFPQRPIQAACWMFLCLAAYVGCFIPFVDELQQAWPAAFAYCAILAIATVGLVRNGVHALILLGILAVAAALVGSVGASLALRPEAPVGSGGDWLRTSLYLFCAAWAWGSVLVVRGWVLHFQAPRVAAEK